MPVLKEMEWEGVGRTSMELRLRPALRMLQIFGYFPGNIAGERGRGRQDWLLRLVCLCFLALNIGIAGMGVFVTYSYYSLVGLWHLFTISSIINGLKPAINVANFLLFAATFTRHRQMLQALSRIDEDYCKWLGSDVRVRGRNLCLIAATSVAGAFVFAIRIVEFFVANEELGSSLTNDVSIILVPVISVWNTLPLCYFILIESLVLSWIRALHNALSTRQAKENNNPRRLKFYYQKFLDLTDVQCSVGDVFGPWILVTLSWTLFSLCLTIYFATKMPALESMPKNIIGLLTMEELNQARLTLRFNIVWSVVQVGIAAITIIVICILGTTVNEETRYLMRPILRSISMDDAPESDRFQVSCFVYKMQTQYVWGATVWRAFPLERSVFFTIASLIATYAVLLLRFNNSVRSASSESTEMVAIPHFRNQTLTSTLATIALNATRP